MDSNLQTVSPTGTVRFEASRPNASSLVPLALLWLMAGWGLANHWRLNPQYQYGWFVPALAAYAAYERWKSRPVPGPPLQGGLWLACILCLLLLPAWVFILPNSAWNLVHWVFVAQISGITLGVIAVLGGWSWVRQFVFPVLLLFTAVPWPDQIESPVMQFMRNAATSAAVLGLDLLGVTVLQHGNILEAAGGWVGVDEACSGIRSLQGSLTASLVLGEFFRFDAGRRLLLVALSVAASFATNFVRVGFLAWNAAHGGTQSVDHWHDRAGMISLLVCVVVIWVVAFRLESSTTRKTVPPRVATAHSLPRWFVPASLAWIGLTVASAEFWYHDPASDPPKPWTLKLPTGHKPLPITPNVWTQLRYDSVTSATWTEDNHTWSLYFFDWDFGPMFSRVSAQNHRPDICLPATGLELQEDRGKLTFSVDGGSLLFHAYSFKLGKDLLFVYHGVWPFRSERGIRQGPLAEGKHLASLRSVLWRERRMGQQSTELTLSGCADATQADAEFGRLLPKLLRRNINSTSP